MKNKIICPECKKENIKKDGKRKTENRGLIQRYKCKECFHRFILDDGFKRMRNEPQKITCAIDLFYRGVSTRKIQEHFKAFYPHNSSHKSIYKWVVKYSKVISRFTDSLKLNTGQELQVDEVEYKRRKNHKKKGIEHNWFIDSIDTTTRFMLGEYVKSRSIKKVKSFLSEIKNKTNNIKTITTDGFLLYRSITLKTFGYNQKAQKYNINHNIVNASEGEGFNHPIERLHNSIRARTKTFRGFHGSLESAKAIMKGLSIYYNFITKHQAINKCPYELATDLELKENNRWWELIKIANQKI